LLDLITLDAMDGFTNKILKLKKKFFKFLDNKKIPINNWK